MTEVLPHLRHHAAVILDRPLSQSEVELFTKYLEILTQWNKIHRLVGSDDPQWLVDNIVLDSLLFLKLLPADVIRLLDVGSGAGVPGIPVKIVRREIELVMVEARRKRASFLSAALRALRLPGVRVVNARVENLDATDLGFFEAIVARCTAVPTLLFQQVGRFLATGGVAIVSGSPEGGASARSDLEWVGVRNPVTRSMRRFAILRVPARPSSPS